MKIVAASILKVMDLSIPLKFACVCDLTSVFLLYNAMVTTQQELHNANLMVLTSHSVQVVMEFPGFIMHMTHMQWHHL